VLYRIFEKTNERAALESAIEQYRLARAAWADLSKRAQGVYVDDVTVGELPQLHGHWLDRLPAIDKDINLLAFKLDGIKPNQPSASVALIIREVLSGSARREALAYRVTPLAQFVRGEPMEIDLTFDVPVTLVNLYYRHLNQAERFRVAVMNGRERHYKATIPATYTDSAYPLQYYFEVGTGSGKKLMCPGFSKELTNQPYIVIRPAASAAVGVRQSRKV
jgi:hypothetical protein